MISATPRLRSIDSKQTRLVQATLDLETEIPVARLSPATWPRLLSMLELTKTGA